ncbi:hypothetical protein BOW57_09800 [Flavobacterium sp. YO64]|nr:hypothetical protein BOW57_09800 [Flavobacterium sp. YO64]
MRMQHPGDTILAALLTRFEWKQAYIPFRVSKKDDDVVTKPEDSDGENQANRKWSQFNLFFCTALLLLLYSIYKNQQSA